MAGKGQPKTGGRKKGTPNKATKEFREIIDSTLFDDPDKTREKLIELRDSLEATDRKTYWALAGKRLPNMVEGKVKGVPLLTLEQDFSTGSVVEVDAEAGGDDG